MRGIFFATTWVRKMRISIRKESDSSPYHVAVDLTSFVSSVGLGTKRRHRGWTTKLGRLATVGGATRYVWFATMNIIHVPFVNIQKTMENYDFLIGKSTMNNIHPLGFKKLPIFPCKMTINLGVKTSFDDYPLVN